MNQTILQPPYTCVHYGQTYRICYSTESSHVTVTTLQAITWAGAARRIPRRRNSAERQYVRYCALGQGCKDPKPLRPVRCCSRHAECSLREQEKPCERNARAVQSARSTSTCDTTSKVQSTS